MKKHNLQQNIQNKKEFNAKLSSFFMGVTSLRNFLVRYSVFFSNKVGLYAVSFVRVGLFLFTTPSHSQKDAASIPNANENP
jgi:hypothetical protein